MSRVAFVTGGGGGIGSAVCRLLAEDGHRVVVADLNEESARAVAAEVGGLGVKLDVTSTDSVRAAVGAAVSAYGPVEICVNVAGWEQKMFLADMDDAHIDTLIDINLTGVVRVVREVAGPMTKARWGRIVNVSSGASNGAPEYSVYGAAKAGVNAFSKAMATELGRYGITSNAMSPGAIQTPLFVSSQGEDYDKTVAIMKQIVPLGRVGEPMEAAAVVRFLVSEEASYVSGQVIAVDGAMR